MVLVLLREPLTPPTSSSPPWRVVSCSALEPQHWTSTGSTLRRTQHWSGERERQHRHGLWGGRGALFELGRGAGGAGGRGGGGPVEQCRWGAGRECRRRLGTVGGCSTSQWVDSCGAGMQLRGLMITGGRLPTAFLSMPRYNQLSCAAVSLCLMMRCAGVCGCVLQSLPARDSA